MRKILLLLILLFVFCACENTDTSNTATSDLNVPPPPRQSEKLHEIADDITIAEKAELKGNTRVVMMQEPPARNKLQKMIRRADVRMQVDDYVKTSKLINTKLKNYQAYITDGTEERAGENLENTLQIRVDNNKFSQLLDDLLEESIYLERKNITVEDVTEEYIDNDARLKTKQKVEQRYLDLLTKAKNVKDILQIEEQLSTIREEIEAKQARLRYLAHQISYSTINLNYYEKIAVAQSPENNFVSRIATSLKIGWNSLVSVVITLISLWPLLIIGLLAAIWMAKTYRKRHPVSM